MYLLIFVQQYGEVNENMPIYMKIESGPKWVVLHTKIQFRKGRWAFLFSNILCSYFIVVQGWIHCTFVSHQTEDRNGGWLDGWEWTL